MVEKKIINEAIELTNNIPSTDDVALKKIDSTEWTNILVPLQLEEKDLTPLPEAEYKVIEAPTMDKLVRDVNTHLNSWWQTEWWVQVVSGVSTRFYQSMIRWNVDANVGLKPEMPCENSEGDTQGPKPLYIPGLEDEPDLYEDINKDATDW